MKSLVILLLLISVSILSALMPSAWSEFQRDIGIQAAQFRDSPELQLYRQHKETRSYIVGDTETFWKWDLSVMPPLWVQTPATCRAVGEHCYIFVADSEWNVHMTQANVDTVLVRLELNTPNNPDQGAIMMDIELFGPIPDELDNDPKLIVFYSALGSFQGTSFDGYFSPYNQVTEAQAQMMNPPGHSNECEMIYMTCYPLNPVAPIRLSVLAHELQHLIHWGQDPNEETWLNEGCSELAMVAYGIPDPITHFPSNPDNSLITWNQQTADYVKVMLFFTYLYEQYGQTGIITDLVADPLNGMASLDNQVAIHFPTLTTGEIIHNWSIANVLDSPQPGNGLYNYETLDLPNFTMTNASNIPNQNNLTIQPYATDYFYNYGTHWGVFYDIVSDVPLYATILNLNNSNQCQEIIFSGYSSFPDVYSYDWQGPSKVVLTNTNATPATYSYFFGGIANEDNITPALSTSITSVSPNPFSGSSEISFSLEKQGFASLKIYNTKGQLVKSILNENKAAGQHTICWNGDSDAGKNLPSGIYMVRLQSGEQVRTAKILYR